MTRTTKTYTTKTDGVDDVLASHVNQLQIDVAKIWNTMAFVGATELTLDAAGAITVTQNYHTVDTFEDAAEDHLTTINLGTNVEEAFFLVVRPDNDGRTVIVDHGVDNILCIGGHDITLDDEESFCILIYDAGLVKWMAFYQLYATAAGKALLDDADAAAQRVTMEVLKFVPLTTMLSSTDWDGDARSTTAKTLIDLSAVFGAPAGIKAVVLRLSIKDSGSAAASAWFMVSPSNAAYITPLSLGIQGVPNDVSRDMSGVCPCDANGDIYYQCGATGAGTLDVYMQIWGYWI